MLIRTIIIHFNQFNSFYKKILYTIFIHKIRACTAYTLKSFSNKHFNFVSRKSVSIMLHPYALVIFYSIAICESWNPLTSMLIFELERELETDKQTIHYCPQVILTIAELLLSEPQDTFQVTRLQHEKSFYTLWNTTLKLS